MTKNGILAILLSLIVFIVALVGWRIGPSQLRKMISEGAVLTPKGLEFLAFPKSLLVGRIRIGYSDIASAKLLSHTNYLFWLLRGMNPQNTIIKESPSLADRVLVTFKPCLALRQFVFVPKNPREVVSQLNARLEPQQESRSGGRGAAE